VTQHQARDFDNATCPDELLEAPWMTPDGLVVTPVGKPQNGDMEKISETIPNPTRKGGFYR